ncbi:hypothetical protein [Stenotrophomonas maltophilia]|uniref:hypothetical protein n=1 Tax=Stenotrophomonas maltophilia TaxID=40324 RepID=UPI00255692C7|nr:hypothetical protein [Stenotrophomonas maltophilia]
MANEILGGVIGGIAGGVAGAIFGYISARGVNTANRKGVRLDQRLDAVDIVLESLVRESVAYWLTSSKHMSAESRIKGLVEDLGFRIYNLGGFGVSNKDVEEAQLLADELADIITGDDFESERRLADADKPERIRIAAAKVSAKFHPHRR